jgi:hypothetical protein
MGGMMPEMTADPLVTFRERCFVTIEAEEAILPTTIDFFDGHAVGWSSDLPHFDCEDYGRPDALVDSPSLTEEQKYCLLYANAVEFFDLKVPAQARAAAE